MNSILNSNSNSTVMLATAMAAVSGTVIVIALRLQKSLQITPQFSVNHPPARSCISSDEKRREKKKNMKRVHFAEDVVNPTGNGEEFRKRFHRKAKPAAATPRSSNNNKVRVGEIPANRMALYNGMLRERVVHLPAYSF